MFSRMVPQSGSFFIVEREKTYPLGRANRFELGDGLTVPVDDADETEALSSS